MKYDFLTVESKLRELDAQIKSEKDEQKREQLINEFNNKKREYDLQRSIAAREAADIAKQKPVTREMMFRENVSKLMKREVNEISFAGAITDSGAVALNIHDVIPTLNEGLGLPVGISIVSGVTGNDVWPVSVNDAEMTELGENEAVSASVIDFTNITATSRRAAVSIPVSNIAIDNAAFNLLGFVQQKITLATRKYLAKKIYSQAAWTGVKGPFSALTKKGDITIGTGAYAAILKAVAEFTDKGFDGMPCLIMDAVTEAELKATPKADGQGGFIIDGGKCAGYDYVVSHYINTKLDTGGNKLVATPDRYLGIGYFDLLQVQQHGVARLTIDATSAAVSAKNETVFTFNTEWSITDLSVKLNDKSGTKTQAFALYRLVAPSV